MRAQTIFNKLLSLQGAFVRGVTFRCEREEHTIVADVVRRTRLHRCTRPTTTVSKAGTSLISRVRLGGMRSWSLAPALS